MTNSAWKSPKGRCLDVLEIDGACNNGVEQVRELREKVQFAPSARPVQDLLHRRGPHALSTAAFNALLKTLEEPPAHVKFIFATTEAHKILPTILSRCQRFDLRRIPTGLIAKHLLHIAQAGRRQPRRDGRLRHRQGRGRRHARRAVDARPARRLLRRDDRAKQDVLDIFGFTQGETVASLARRVLDRDTVGALRELHTQADGGKDLSRLLADLIQHFRTVLVHQVDAAAAEEDLSPEVAAMTREQAGMIEAERLLRVMDGLAEVDARMRWASNKLLHLELGVIQAVQTMGEVTLSDVIAAIGEGDATSGRTTTRSCTSGSCSVVAAAPQTGAPGHQSEPAARSPY